MSGDKRNGASGYGVPLTYEASGQRPTGAPPGASVPSPPAQPRKGAGSRPSLSARSGSSVIGGPPVNGPLVASVLGGYASGHYGRTASPGPQRVATSPQHATSHRSSSAALQRPSSSRQRGVQGGALQAKPLFAAYGLQYSANNSPRGTSMTGRPVSTMTPYRTRPSSSTSQQISNSIAAAAAVPAAIGNRPSSSQAPQRPAGDHWHGGAKLAVTIPTGHPAEMGRAVQDLGQLLSVFSPTSPGTGPSGAKAAASFRASKYGGGAGSGSGAGGVAAYREAWTSSGGPAATTDGGVNFAGSGHGSGGAMTAGALARPISASSSQGGGIVSKPVMPAYMADGRHGQGANLSLIRLQQQHHQQQQSQHVGIAPPVATSGNGSGAQLGTNYNLPFQQHTAGQAGAGSLGYPATVASQFHTTYLQFQPPSSTAATSNGGAALRVAVGPGGGSPPSTSPKEPASGGASGSSPHVHILQHHTNAAVGQAVPASIQAGAPPRPWNASPVHAAQQQPMSQYSHQVSSAGIPATSTAGPASASGAPHHLPYTPAHDSVQTGSASTTGHQPLGFHAYAATAPPSAGFAAAMAAAAAAAQGSTAGQYQLPSVPPLYHPAAGPGGQAVYTALGSGSFGHSGPNNLHGHSHLYGAPGASAPATAMMSVLARPPPRDGLLVTNASSSGNLPGSASSSFSSQQQPAGGAATGLGRSALLANAPHPVGLPPPSPAKLGLATASSVTGPLPPGTAPPPRGAFIRSNSSRSSNGSSAEQMPFYGGSNLPYQDNAEPAHAGPLQHFLYSTGVNSAPLPNQPQTPTRALAGAHPGSVSAGGTSASPCYGSYGASGSTSGGSHVTWGANGAFHGLHVQGANPHPSSQTGAPTQASVPTTPTRPQPVPSPNDASAAARRASTGSNLAFLGDYGSPFARGSEGYSRMALADQHGTLTCVRPSTVPSNFAADSQTDLGGLYGYDGGSAAASPSRFGMGAVMTASGSGNGVASGAASPGPSSRQPWMPMASGSTATGMAPAALGSQPGSSQASYAWRQSVDGLEHMQHGATGTAAAAANGTAAGSRTSSQPQHEVQLHVQSSGQPPAPARIQQQQEQLGHAQYGATAAGTSGGGRQSAAGESDVTKAAAGSAAREREREHDSTPTRTYGSAAGASTAGASGTPTRATDALAAAAAAATAAAAAAAAVQQAAIAAAEAATSSMRAASAANGSASKPAAAAAAGTTAQSNPHQPSLSRAAPAAPQPADQAARPKPAAAAALFAPLGEAGARGGGGQQSAANAKPQGPAGNSTAQQISTGTAPGATPAPSVAAPAKSTARVSGTAPVPAAAPAAPSTAGTSVAGSAGSTASTTNSSGAGSTSTTSTLVSGPVQAAAPRFNPVTVLGGEPDATFGSLLPGYSVGKVIGEGGFCQVRLAVHHLSQRKVAVKVIDKAKLADPNEAKRMQREIRVMKHLSHQCVIKLFEVVDSARHLFLVMEHAPAGSLLDYVRARKRLSEADACVFFQQVVASLEYCHAREVVHRDIKLENILLDVEQRMKLIDFGLSAFFVPGKRLRVHCGSPSYAAPEIVARKAYDGPPVDVWSLGVVLFAMVAGYLPFHASGGNKQELCNKIMAGQYTAPDWLSSSMKDLLARMLTTDPEKRITFPQVWQHSWVRNGPQWHERGVNCYEVPPDAAAPGGLRLDEAVASELEAAGFSRAVVAQNLASGESNHITASYFLLAEGRAEAARRGRMSGVGSTSSRGLGSGSARTALVSSTAQGAAAAPTHASAGANSGSSARSSSRQGAAGESPARAGGSSRPSTAVGGTAGYSSRRAQGGEEGAAVMFVGGTGRMAVAV